MTAISDESALREQLGEPAEVVRAKVSDRLNDLTRRFVDLSPFVLLATAAPDGKGKPPKLGLRIEIDEVFTHCPTSFDAETYDAERAERYARCEGFY